MAAPTVNVRPTTVQWGPRTSDPANGIKNSHHSRYVQMPRVPPHVARSQDATLLVVSSTPTQSATYCEPVILGNVSIYRHLQG